MKTKLVCAVLDIVQRSVEWDDDTLHRFFHKLGESGVDYIRIFPMWDLPLMPYRKRPSGLYDLDLWNPTYFDALAWVAMVAYQWKIGIYFDLFDHCFTKEPTRHLHPWYNNVNSVDGIYKIGKTGLKYHKQWIKKIWETMGERGYYYNKWGIKRNVRRNLLGLGNELDGREAWSNNKEYHKWADTWGYGLAEYMRTLGYKKEVMFSAETKTAHALRAYLDKGDPWVKKHHPDCPFSKKDTVHQHHGWISFLDPPECKSIVKNTFKRKIGYSDDGVNFKWRDSKYDGICIEQGDKLKYCSAPTRSVIRLCQFIKGGLRYKWQFHHIEQLPRSVSEIEHSLDDIDRHRDVNIYHRIGKQVFGKDIRRKYPKWLLERHGIKE